MSEPNAECEAAVANSKSLTERPGNAKKKPALATWSVTPSGTPRPSATAWPMAMHSSSTST